MLKQENPMSAKKKLLAISVLSIALAGCAARGGKLPFGPAPGGPIIVIVPDSDTPAFPGLRQGPKDYTVWSAGCPDSNDKIPLADYADTYKGIPKRLGSTLGAEKIVVVLKPGHKSYPFEFDGTGNSFTAKTFTLKFANSKSLTVEFTGLWSPPTWRVAPPTEELKPKRIVPLHNFSSSVFGHIAKVTVTDTAGHTAEVVLNDLSDIKILYAKDDEIPGAPCK